MTIKFKNKSMNFFYKMMMIRFEMSIDEVKRVYIKQLNTFLKNEMAGVIFIYAITEYILKSILMNMLRSMVMGQKNCLM